MEVNEQVSSGPQTLAEPVQRQWRKNPAVRWLCAGVFVFGIAGLYPIGGQRSAVAPEGGVWNGDDVVAEFSFPIARSEAAYDRDLDSVTQAVMPVFVIDPKAETEGTIAVALFVERARIEAALSDTAGFPAPVRGPLAAAIAAHPGRDEIVNAVNACSAALREAYHGGIIDIPRVGIHTAALAVRHEHSEAVRPADSALDVAEVAARLQMRLASRGASHEIQNLAAAAVRSVLSPNLRYDSAATAAERREAINSVPRTSGIVTKGERLIARDQRVDAAALERLSAYDAVRGIRGEGHTLRQYLSAVFQLLLLLLLVVFYLVTLRRRLLADNQQLVIATAIILFEAVLAFATMRVGGNLPLEYLIVVPAAAMFGTIIFDSRTGFFLAVVVALVVAGIRGNDFYVAISALVAGGIAAYTVRDIRSRTQLFRSIGYILLGYAGAIAAAAMSHATAPSRVAIEISFALMNAVMSPVLTYALLLVVERVFHVTSDLTLLEFDDINHPLLKELSTSAPGTFHHTMVIADMAERAANAIGANATLAKVGAYYHDIGKISSPEFFVENQLGMRNKHERLSPLHSARIIMQHVPDGLELARRHRVPQKIAEFIPMHHGTTTIAFFYDRALRRRRREDVRIEDYRYAGPRPRSKETAIVMLADSVEATIRSSETTDEAAIEKTVERTIRTRFIEGQLDECALTASDLAAVREQFVEILVGIHHPRVKYPESPGSDAIPAIHDEPPGEGPQDIPPPTDGNAEPVEPNEHPL